MKNWCKPYSFKLIWIIKVWGLPTSIWHIEELLCHIIGLNDHLWNNGLG